MKKFLMVCALALFSQSALAEEPIKFLTQNTGKNIKIGTPTALPAKASKKELTPQDSGATKRPAWTSNLYAGASGLELVNRGSRALAGEVSLGYRATDYIAYEAGLILPISDGLTKHLPAGTLSFIGKIPLSRDVSAMMRVGGMADGTWGDFYAGAGVVARVTKRIDLRFEARTKGVQPSAVVVAGFTHSF